MSVQQIESSPISKDVIERVLIHGDLSRLDTDQKLAYYNQLCTRLGLDPVTRPLEYIKLQGKETLYFRKDATEQLRKINNITIDKVEENIIQDFVYVVTVYGHDKNGRNDVAKGAVSISGLRGDALANAIMKAETKAKRRFTLSICGIGYMDESEIETIPELKKISQDNSVKPSPEKEKGKWMDIIEASKDIPDLQKNFTEAYKYAKKIEDNDFMSTLVTLKDMKKEEFARIEEENASLSQSEENSENT